MQQVFPEQQPMTNDDGQNPLCAHAFRLREEPEAMRFHEVASLFPLMEQEEFQALLEDIHIHGLREPIWTYQHTIIDGRNRYRACQALNKAPSFREWSGEGSLVAFVVSLNLKRRHLTSSQRAMVAVQIEAQLAKEATSRVGGRPSPTRASEKPPTILSAVSRESAHQAAKMVGSNGTYVKEAKYIVANAPELEQPVLHGLLKIPEAKVLAHLPLDQRSAVVEQVTTGEAKNVRAALLACKKRDIEAQVQASPTRPQVIQASWETWLPVQPPCDVLLTDPPYATDIADIASFAQSWLPLALSKVRATGHAYVCIGAYPQELHAYLSVPVPEHLRLHNVLVWTYKNTIGPSPKDAYKQNWQAILYYAGVDAAPLDCPLLTEQFSVQEINAPDGRLGNRYHTWQKPDALAERFIRHSTKPGDTVLDCFAGTGTFLLAAHRLGRIALGCDPSEAMLTIAEQRGCARVQ